MATPVTQPIAVAAPVPAAATPAAAPQPIVQPVYLQPVAVQQPQEAKKKSGKGWKIALISVASLIVLTVGSLFAIFFTAQGMFNNGQYSKARSCYDVLGGFMNSDEKVKLCDYTMAGKYAEDGNHKMAWKLYSGLGDYRDSRALSVEAMYNHGIALFEDGAYEEAGDIFFSIEDYKDSDEWLVDCTIHQAIEMYRDGDYEEAAEIFDEFYDESDLAKAYGTLCLMKEYEDGGASLILTQAFYIVLAEYDDIDDVKEALESPFFYIARFFDAGWESGKYYLDAETEKNLITHRVPWDSPRGDIYFESDDEALHFYIEDEWWFSITGFNNYSSLHPTKMYVEASDGESYEFTKYTEF